MMKDSLKIHEKGMIKLFKILGDKALFTNSTDKTKRFNCTCTIEKSENETYLESEKINRAVIIIKVLKKELSEIGQPLSGYKEWKIRYKGLSYNVLSEHSNGSWDTVLELYCERLG